MKLTYVIKRAVAKFRNESGSFSVEAVIMFPMLVWAFVAMFVFFEGLRESNINLKATYTVSDLLSRQTELITDDHLIGMNNVYAWLTRSQNDVSMRVTAVSYDSDSDSHVLRWSEGVGKEGLTQEQVDALVSPNIPIMADSSWAVVVETWGTYTPIMDIGLAETDIYNLVVTSPRFSDILDYEGRGDGGGGDGHDDQTDDPDEDDLDSA